ncbi:MAG: hypothetical protein JKY49_14050 [Cohaesibacteraceae bacterium]|nr:hypothetical protein [Cohaesibacteraceae bacterium]MBL4876803.1 hypothetical protein [Cohaesibacteraceae bacterium]
MSETPKDNPEGSDKQKSTSYTEVMMESARKSPGFQGASTGWQQPSGALFSSGEISDKKLSDSELRINQIKKLGWASTIISGNRSYCACLLFVISIAYQPAMSGLLPALGSSGIIIPIAIFVFFGFLAWGLGRRNIVAAVIWTLIAILNIPGLLSGADTSTQYSNYDVQAAGNFGAGLAWFLKAGQVIFAGFYVWAFFVLRSHDKAQNEPNGSETETTTS